MTDSEEKPDPDTCVMTFQLSRLLPTLRSLGYDGEPVRTRLRGHTAPFQVSVGYNVHDKTFFRGAKAQLYARDSYPTTGKREAVLHLWNWCGVDSKAECRRVAEALTRAGVPARYTRYQKFNVVAFDPGEWLEVGLETVLSSTRETVA